MCPQRFPSAGLPSVDGRDLLPAQCSNRQAVANRAERDPDVTIAGNTPDRDLKASHTADTTVATLTPAQRQVAAVLAEMHEATAAEINALALVSKSSAAKTLALLETSGAAIRTIREHDGYREADLWSPGPALAALLSAGAKAPERPALSAGAAADIGVGDDAEPDPVLPLMPQADSTTTEAGPQGPTPNGATTAAGTKRLAPGELAAMVNAMLQTHPDVEYTPTMLSHMLEGRSSGAIHNVLEKMVDSGAAVRTCDKPKRYRLVEAQTSASG